MTDKTFAVILERWLAGDSMGSLSIDYDVDFEEIEQLLREYFDGNQ